MTVNLDALSADELMAFWNKHQAGRRYREILPDGARGAKNAVSDLANYAANAATAQRCRLKGEIATAQMYESICQRIYNKLPDFARW